MLDISEEEIGLIIWGLEELIEIYDKKLMEDPDDHIYKGIYEKVATLLKYLKNNRD